MPLGFSYIGACLRQGGHTVSIFDRNAYRERHNADREKVNAAMLEHVKVFRPDMIGLTTKSPLIYDTVECTGLIRGTFSGPMLAGGHHASAVPRLTLEKIPGLSMVVEGEGEVALARLADGADPSTVPGVWWRDGGSIFHTPPRQIEDLDSLPFPALDLLDLDYYTRPGLQTIPGHYISSVCLLTSRGCTRRCSFCTEALTYGRGVRYHSPGYVLGLMEKTVSDHGVEGLYIHDNNFLADKERALDICRGMISRGLSRKLKWAAQARADCLDRETLQIMKRAGCIKIEVGIESPLQGQLDSFKKGSTVAINERAIALCREAGIGVHAYMITGTRGETMEDLEQKLAWVKKVRPDTFSWSRLSLYPGTPLYEDMGGSFFEKSPWDQKSVDGFYSREWSGIPPQDKKNWRIRSYEKYHKKHHRLYKLKVNLPFKIFKLAVRKIIKSLPGAKKSLSYLWPCDRIN